VIKVLIVDDSALMRQLLQQLLSLDPEIEVVGAAADPFAAWEEIKRARPDVLTLDVEMPRMDGIAFLERLMAHFPMPVVMVSSLTQRGCDASVRALGLGAIDVIAKPTENVVPGLETLACELIDKIKIAAHARPRRPTGTRRAASTTEPGPIPARAFRDLIAIGASTGGPTAVETVLRALPAGAPGVVVVQHMPERFTAPFAARLDQLTPLCVREASDGDRVVAGHVLIAPGGRHMRIRRDDAGYRVVLDDSPPLHRVRPAVDPLFESCARIAGRRAVGIVLTGMGRDGTAGLLAMRQAGAHTIAQDEASCVVFGMPREAIEAGAAIETRALRDIAAAAMSSVSGRRPLSRTTSRAV
jgi:two-component system chemotaxis response regulator CheB